MFSRLCRAPSHLTGLSDRIEQPTLLFTAFGKYPEYYTHNLEDLSTPKCKKPDAERKSKLQLNVPMAAVARERPKDVGIPAPDRHKMPNCPQLCSNGQLSICAEVQLMRTAATTKRPLVRVYSQVDRQMILSPYLGVIPVS